MDVTFDSVDKRNLPYNQEWKPEISHNDKKTVKVFFTNFLKMNINLISYIFYVWIVVNLIV